MQIVKREKKKWTNKIHKYNSRNENMTVALKFYFTDRHQIHKIVGQTKNVFKEERSNKTSHYNKIDLRIIKTETEKVITTMKKRKKL